MSSQLAALVGAAVLGSCSLDSSLPRGDKNGTVTLTGAFVGGGAQGAEQAEQAEQRTVIELHGVFVWHGSLRGAKDGVTLEGWLR